MKFLCEQCPICDSGEWQPKSDDVYTFRHGRRTHQVAGLHHAICNKCGTRGYLHGQRKANQLLVKKYQETLLGYVSPSDVLAVRERYLLTQTQANKIFGGGSQGFSKWERGITSPAGTTARLIKLALKYPEVMRALANESGVELTVPVVSHHTPLVVIVSRVSVEKIQNYCDDNATCNDSSFDVEQDENIWPVMERNHHKAHTYLN